jgi:hypothetical protein
MTSVVSESKGCSSPTRLKPIKVEGVVVVVVACACGWLNPTLFPIPDTRYPRRQKITQPLCCRAAGSDGYAIWCTTTDRMKSPWRSFDSGSRLAFDYDNFFFFCLAASVRPFVSPNIVASNLCSINPVVLSEHLLGFERRTGYHRPF